MGAEGADSSKVKHLKERERVDPFFDGTHFTRIVLFPISNAQMIAISQFTLSK